MHMHSFIGHSVNTNQLSYVVAYHRTFVVKTEYDQRGEKAVSGHLDSLRAVALTVGSVPHGIVPKLHQFN